MMIIISIFILLLEITSQKEVNFTFWCANESCTIPISEAKVRVKTFSPGHELQVYVKSGDKVEIYEKSNETSQYKVKVKRTSKEGLLPKSILNEEKKNGVEKPFFVIRALPEEFKDIKPKTPETEHLVGEDFDSQHEHSYGQNKSKSSSNKLIIFFDLVGVTKTLVCAVKNETNFNDKEILASPLKNVISNISADSKVTGSIMETSNYSSLNNASDSSANSNTLELNSGNTTYETGNIDYLAENKSEVKSLENGNHTSTASDINDEINPFLNSNEEKRKLGEIDSDNIDGNETKKKTKNDNTEQRLDFNMEPSEPSLKNKINTTIEAGKMDNVSKEANSISNETKPIENEVKPTYNTDREDVEQTESTKMQIKKEMNNTENKIEPTESSMENKVEKENDLNKNNLKNIQAGKMDNVSKEANSISNETKPIENEVKPTYNTDREDVEQTESTEMQIKKVMNNTGKKLENKIEPTELSMENKEKKEKDLNENFSNPINSIQPLLHNSNETENNNSVYLNVHDSISGKVNVVTDTKVTGNLISTDKTNFEKIANVEDTEASINTSEELQSNIEPELSVPSVSSDNFANEEDHKIKTNFQTQSQNDNVSSDREMNIENINAKTDVDIESYNTKDVTFEQEKLESADIFNIIFEYIPNFYTIRNYLGFSYVANNLSELPNIFNFNNWFSKNEEIIENQIGSAESNRDSDRKTVEEMKARYTFSDPIELPFWGKVSPSEQDAIFMVLRLIFTVSILVAMLLSIFANMKKNRKEKSLYGVINKLENKLLVATKEILLLQDRLNEKNDECDRVNQSQMYESLNGAEKYSEIAEAFQEKTIVLQKKNTELEDKVLYLEKELENVSTSALEMHKLLENSLTTQVSSKATEDEIEILRTLIETRENQLEELKKEMDAITIENQCLKEDNEVIKTALKNLEKEANNFIKKNLELSGKNRELALQLDREIENNSSVESSYKSEIYRLKSKLEDLEINLKRSEFQVDELNRAFSDKQEGRTADEIRSYDNVQLKIQLSTLEAMNNELTAQLKEEKNARRMLEEHVGDMTKELNNLKRSYQVSEKERIEAVTKLQVLTDYFRDKESELHKALEVKAKMYTEYESKDQLLSQKLTLLKDEINNYKTQNEELKREILDQEASYKFQLANAEQKTREHWFALRQAERKYKESQQEAACLRNKILLLENSPKPDEKSNNGMNGDISSSTMLFHPALSPEMLPYHSPSEFIPPPPSPINAHTPNFFPPEPLYSPDERLPPLGGRRAPTPPPHIITDEDEFAPPPPMKFAPVARNHNAEQPATTSYMIKSTPPSSRHRSQFKMRLSRSSIDSPSSGVSVESLDKSGR